jgi:hypothetical protein
MNLEEHNKTAEATRSRLPANLQQQAGAAGGMVINHCLSQ